MSDKITVKFQRTIQVVDYEPIVYSATHTTDRIDDEPIQRTRDRAETEGARTFNQVQDEIIATFGCGALPQLPGPLPRRSTTTKKKAPPKKGT